MKNVHKLGTSGSVSLNSAVRWLANKTDKFFFKSFSHHSNIDESL